MKPYRGNAIAVGVLFIACSAASILSAIPLGSALEGSDYLSRLAGLDARVVETALIEFLWAATGAGIAIGLYPVLRTHSRALALGSVAARVVEGGVRPDWQPRPAGSAHGGFTTVNTVLNIPIGVQEMVLAVWLIVKGFEQAPLGAMSTTAPPPAGQPAPPVASEEPDRVLRHG